MSILSKGFKPKKEEPSL